MNIVRTKDLEDVNRIVEIHLSSFPGFFLTFLGEGFLKYLYKGYIKHPDSGIIVASEENQIIGFLAYSTNISQFYSFLLKKYFFPFAWYGFLGALRSPKSILRIIRALTYPNKTKENHEKYVEISSIAVNPKAQTKGIGSDLIKFLCESFIDSPFKQIRLETDAENNSKANAFYQKNGFIIEKTSISPEGRVMNHYVKNDWKGFIE